MNQGGSKSITLSYSDPGDQTTHTFTITQQPAHGSLSGSGGARTYTPSPAFSGTDSFKWKVTDGDGAASNVATVTITVTPNQVPTVSNVTVRLVQGGTADIQLAYADADGPGPYTVTITQQPAHGTLSGTGAARTYQPDSGYSGQDSFKWKVSDGLNTSAEATVTISVEGDSDGDGLPDGWETQYGLNPNSNDSDGDGILDGQEDEDFDGRTNLDEYARGSHPFESDGDSNVGMMSCAGRAGGGAASAAVVVLLLLAAVLVRRAGRTAQGPA
jgi:hypothetical protein